MKLVYICSPYRGNVKENVEYAELYCGSALYEGYCPIAPHLYFTKFLNDEMGMDREKGFKCALAVLEKCDEVWVYGQPTEGMAKEIKHARKHLITIKFYDKQGWPLKEEISIKGKPAVEPKGGRK